MALRRVAERARTEAVALAAQVQVLRALVARGQDAHGRSCAHGMATGRQVAAAEQPTEAALQPGAEAGWASGAAQQSGEAAVQLHAGAAQAGAEAKQPDSIPALPGIVAVAGGAVPGQSGLAAGLPGTVAAQLQSVTAAAVDASKPAELQEDAMDTD
eukprot:291789-Chlamydomonas_euryale.AAC.1